MGISLIGRPQHLLPHACNALRLTGTVLLCAHHKQQVSRDGNTAATGTTFSCNEGRDELTKLDLPARGRAALLLAGTALAALPATAWAQASTQQTPPAATASTQQAPQAGKLQDIVVTARHRRENVQKIPLAISVLSGQQLQERGINSLAQVQHNTPNLVSYAANGRNSSIAIRGIGVDSASDGLDTTVGVYVDEWISRPSRHGAGGLD